ncbi:MAG: tRNA guanosine(34) transglycosylase Tgt [Ignavibacteria bacterium]|nr:tRNA guanosine(34) transglycosylase Tgt [Ignavibacteria bacterium]
MTGDTGFFRVLSKSQEAGVKARTGIVRTGHSEFETPAFMPVGTLGTVKALEQRELDEMGAGIILGNTYHLFLRPGTEILSKAGGLHRFMNWNRSILTDSGGFQIFSLAKFRKMKEEGVEFSSHLSGDKFFLTPEKVIDIQRTIGSDIMMPLDECLAGNEDKSVFEKSVKLTTRWEKRCLNRFRETVPLYSHRQMLFSICQGGVHKDLRRQSIEDLAPLDFDGNAIGGLAVGEAAEAMYDTVDFCTDILPSEKPRYLMGVGTPTDLLECVERGVDMFDCVLPTRNARHGKLFTSGGEISLKSAKFKDCFESPDPGVSSYTSDNFTLAYLRHLFISNEILGIQLATIHNVAFYLALMKRIRRSVAEGRFTEFKRDFLSGYKNGKPK